MKEDFALLYFGTFAMLGLTLTLIMFVLWASKTIGKINRQNENRDRQFEILKTDMKDNFEQILSLLLK